MRTFITTVAVVALSMAVSSGADAQEAQSKHITELRFDAPVQVPGATLPPGRYYFELATASLPRQVIQVWTEDRSQMVAMAFAIPTSRPQPVDTVHVTMARSKVGGAPAVVSWTYPGETTGHKFVYPEEQARRIAQDTQELVLSTDADPRQPAQADPNVFVIDPRGQRQAYQAEPMGAGTTGAGARTATAGTAGSMSASEHIEKASSLLSSLLQGRTGQAGAGQAVGTAGAAGDMVSVPRSELEAIRMHLQQAKQALEHRR